MPKTVVKSVESEKLGMREMGELTDAILEARDLVSNFAGFQSVNHTNLQSAAVHSRL